MMPHGQSSKLPPYKEVDCKTEILHNVLKQKFDSSPSNGNEQFLRLPIFNKKFYPLFSLLASFNP